jgi:hypothetical protein
MRIFFSILLFISFAGNGQRCCRIVQDAAPPFSPASITGLKFWQHAPAITGLVDADPITTWTGSGGTGVNATASSTARPLYKTGIVNSNPVARWDGSNDRMVVGSSTGLKNTAAFTLFITMRPGSLALTKAIVSLWTWTTDGGWSLCTDGSSTSDLRMYVAASAGDNGSLFINSTNASMNTTDFAVYVIVYDGAQSNGNRVKFYKNGTLLTSSVTGTIPSSIRNTSAPLWLGEFEGLSLNESMDILDVGGYDTALSSGDITSLTNVLKSYAGL